MLTSVMIDQAAELPRRLAEDGVLPDTGGAPSDDPDDGRFAARPARLPARVDAGGARRVQRPSRWRFRYRPFREMPSALAAASTRPWCSRSATLIISRSMRASVGISLSCSGTAISRPLEGARGRSGARRISSERACGAASSRVRRARSCGAARCAAAGRCRATGRAAGAPWSLRRGGSGPCRIPRRRVRRSVDEPRNFVAPLAQRAKRQADHVQAIEEILAEPSVFDDGSRFEFVAAMMRTSTVSGVASPSGQISPDSRKRSSFGCRSRPSSPISSRNSVPSRAARMTPGLSRSAPVKAPRR